VASISLPKCQLPLAQAVTYLACAPKSNAACMAILTAREDVRAGRTLAVPQHLRDSHYRGAEQFGHGTDYKYAHDYAGGFVEQNYLPEARRYYEPTDRGFEAELRKRLEALRQKPPAAGETSG
jgi:putative ATPase